MSKVKAKILEILADGKWHSSTEIVDFVSTSACTSKEKVYQVISTLSGGHLVDKEHTSGGMCRYRALPVSPGFGISPNISQFQQLLNQARAR